MAAAGGIGFVGLMAPHIARKLVGPSHEGLLPVAALTGGMVVGNPHQVMTETRVREVFGLDCQIVKDPVAGTPLCIPIGRKAAV